MAGRSAIQSDVDANQVVTDAVKTSLGGLVNGSGVYQAFSGTNYLDGNASVHADLSDLDAAPSRWSKLMSIKTKVTQMQKSLLFKADVNANEGLLQTLQ